MKKIIYILFLFIITNQPDFSQEETLIGSEEVSHGGYGAPVVKFTKINGSFALLVGGKGGWIINHTFVIGGGGYGLANNLETGKIILGQNQLINFSYGGVILEYINNSDKLIHFTAGVLIGGGTLNFKYHDISNDHNRDIDSDNSNFFAVEPSINIELNITNFMRISAGADYRFISGVKFDDFKNSDFAGPSATVMLKFGEF
jgi:hypothetical protein